jgi:hypothetical protein
MRSLEKTLVAAAEALAIIAGAGVAAGAVQQLPSTDHATAQLVALRLQWPHCQPAGPKSGAFCWSPLPPASGQGNTGAGRSLQPGGSPTQPASSRS